MGKNSQRAKLSLKAIPHELTERKDDYYLNVKTQRQLTLDDLAAEVAATHGHQNASEVAMLTREVLELANWYLSNGFTVTTPQGSFRTTVQGIVLETDIASAPNRDKLKLNVAYTMSEDMRQALDDAELDVEIIKSAVGPQLFGVADARQLEQSKLPDADTRAPIPVEAGQTCILRGRNIKVGGEGAEIGVTLRRTDGSSGTTLFFPQSKLYPNTPTQVGFVLPADTETGSTWEVTLCTQLGSNGSKLLKEPRTVVMDSTFTVGQTAETPGGGNQGGTGGNQGGSGDDEEDPMA